MWVLWPGRKVREAGPPVEQLDQPKPFQLWVVKVGEEILPEV